MLSESGPSSNGESRTKWLLLQRCRDCRPLLAGRTAAKDNLGRLPATDEQIKAVKTHVSQLVKDLIDVQRFTGARAGELLLLTPEKLDTAGKVWLFHVEGHKTEHHGHVESSRSGPVLRPS